MNPGGLFWHTTLDHEEVVNQLSQVAADLVSECDPRIVEGEWVPLQYMENKHYLALNTLASIALLPSTEDDR